MRGSNQPETAILSGPKNDVGCAQPTEGSRDRAGRDGGNVGAHDDDRPGWEAIEQALHPLPEVTSTLATSRDVRWKWT